MDIGKVGVWAVVPTENSNPNVLMKEASGILRIAFQEGQGYYHQLDCQPEVKNESCI
jgi:hypothetical protein